jgi:hypothetical protein
VVKYYASGWKLFGTTDENGIVQKDDLLPGKYKFRMEYGGARQEVYHDFSTEQPLVFQTVEVTVNLKDSAGTTGALPQEGAAKYYASGWKTIGGTTGGIVSIELLPLKYKFRMEYGGARQEFYQDVGQDNSVDFQTASVTVNLKDSNDNTGELPEEGTARYYASGWKTIGQTQNGVASIELLPVKYKFRVEYRGARVEKYQTIQPGSNKVDFKTANVVASLKNCQGVGQVDATMKFYASGWKTLGQTGTNGEASAELLPVKYKFRVEYGGARNEKYQKINENPNVAFTTTTVTFQFCGTIKYYASGWKTFTKPTMEMLPGKYTFKLDSLTIGNVAVSGCSLDGDLTVEIPGLSGIRVEIRTPDGSLVTYKNNQSDQAVFDLDNGIYDVVLKKGDKTKTAEDVVVIGQVTLDNLVSVLNLDYEGLSGVRLEIKTTSNGLMQYHNNQSGEKAYPVLRNHYNLVFKKGAKTKVVENWDCTGASCAPLDFVADLVVPYEGLSGIRLEIHTDDGDADSVGGLVEYHNNQSGGSRTYKVLKNSYDLLFSKGEKTKIVDAVDYTDEACEALDIATNLNLDYEGLSGVRLEIKTTSNGLMEYHNNQSGDKAYPVLRNHYNLVFKKGAKTKVVENWDCTGATACDPLDFVATLTVDLGTLTGVRVEIRTASGGLVEYHNNQSGEKSYDVLKNFYDLHFEKGSHTGTASVNCTGDTCTLGGSNLKVYGPSTARVTVDGTGKNLGWDREATFSNLPIGLYDVVIKQDKDRADSPTYTEQVFHVAGTTLHWKKIIKAIAPPNEGVTIKTPSDVYAAGIGSVGSDGWQNLEVIPGVYKVIFTQGPASYEVTGVDVTSTGKTVDGECSLTVDPAGEHNGDAYVYLPGTTTQVVGTSNAGWDGVVTFKIVKGTYDVASGGSTKPNIDCTVETKSVVFP